MNTPITDKELNEFKRVVNAAVEDDTGSWNTVREEFEDAFTPRTVKRILREYETILESAKRLSKDADDYQRIALDQEIELEKVTASNEERMGALEIAWGVIANAKNWDYDIETEWTKAATRWRDRYHAILNKALKL